MCGVTIWCGCFSYYVCMIYELWPIGFLVEKLMSPAVSLQSIFIVFWFVYCLQLTGKNKTINHFGSF